jgi:hypothetical protein
MFMASVSVVDPSAPHPRYAVSPWRKLGDLGVIDRYFGGLAMTCPGAFRRNPGGGFDIRYNAKLER